MFELISQIPFHFTTSLCSLMDPIYYIYHKLYHIFGDHVGHCHQACLCVHAVAPADGREVRNTPAFSQRTFHLLQIKTSQSGPAKAQWQRWRDDGPINSDASAVRTDNIFARETPHMHSENRHLGGEGKLIELCWNAKVSVQLRYFQPWGEWFKSV